jgi:sialidase-1
MKKNLNSAVVQFPFSHYGEELSKKVLRHRHFMQVTMATTLFVLFLVLISSCHQETDMPERLSTKSGQNQEFVGLMSAAVHTSIKLFDGGTGGFHAYRIPSIVRTTNGTLIAFCEGRADTDNDFGNINVVCKRSSDNGATWLALQTVAGATLGTWGNPTSVVDWDTGRVWLFMSWNDADHSENGTGDTDPIDTWGQRRVKVTWSDNNGATWAIPVDKTSTLLPSTMTWDVMGPGVGIQTTGGAHPGRLIIPARRRNIYSDDHGATWQYQIIPAGTDEGTIVERADGTLMRNDRPGGTPWDLAKRRHISTGTIENGFSAFTPASALPDPRCEGSITRYAGDRSRIIFLNSASELTRYNMMARVSYDEGQTWYASRRLHNTITPEEAAAQGKGGYSSMTKTADFAIGALVEQKETPTGTYNSNWSIEFQKFNLTWLLNGQPEP